MTVFKVLKFQGVMIVCAVFVIMACAPRLLLADSTTKEKKGVVLWVDSYHQGYPWSDGIERGVRRALEGNDVELEIIRMDTKRNQSELYKKDIARLSKQRIDAIKPDFIITSDDNAQKYLVVPYLKDIGIPVVYCGVNADPETYGFPTQMITGMQEIEPFQALASVLTTLGKGGRAAYISGDVPTDHKVFEKTNKTIFQNSMKGYFAKTYAAFETLFLKAQEENDIVMLVNNAGIQGWDHGKAVDFLMKNTHAPTGSVMTYMKEYVILTLGKDAEEQGEYAAKTGLLIMAGASAEDFAPVTNKRVLMTVNLRMAQAAGVILPVNVLKAASEVLGKGEIQ